LSSEYRGTIPKIGDRVGMVEQYADADGQLESNGRTRPHHTECSLEFAEVSWCRLRIDLYSQYLASCPLAKGHIPITGSQEVAIGAA
jgi:hypothetical protein